MAERIIEYRSSRAFRSREDIMSVDGIGSKTYEKIKDHITV
jgi:DNA uptake protein ComE-like DNA-binding protein